jgi:NTE family protein
MTRALVLGGGGPVGIGWEAGLLVGLARSGVDVGLADLVVGTSAGSVVGFYMASGRDLTEATELVAAAGDAGPAAPAESADAEAQALEPLMAALAEAAANPSGAGQARARLGRLALDAVTIDEATWLAMFDVFAGAEWPDQFRCTAVDTADGTFKVWSGSDGVDVQHAVASSCAVPVLFPPVTIGGRRWMDGGVRDMLNADQAAGHGTVLAVSCTLLELPPELSIPEFDAVFGATRAHLDGLRDGGSKVETIVPGPEMLELSGYGLNLMDFTKAGAAYDAGVRQGEQEAGRLAGFWAD